MKPKDLYTAIVIMFPFISLLIAIWISLDIGLRMFGSYLLTMVAIILLERLFNKPSDEDNTNQLL